MDSDLLLFTAYGRSGEAFVKDEHGIDPMLNYCSCEPTDRVSDKLLVKDEHGIDPMPSCSCEPTGGESDEVSVKIEHGIDPTPDCSCEPTGGESDEVLVKVEHDINPTLDRSCEPTGGKSDEALVKVEHGINPTLNCSCQPTGGVSDEVLVTVEHSIDTMLDCEPAGRVSDEKLVNVEHNYSCKPTGGVSGEVLVKVEHGIHPTLDYSCEPTGGVSDEVLVEVEHGMDPKLDCSFMIKYRGRPNEPMKELVTDPLYLNSGNNQDRVHHSSSIIHEYQPKPVKQTVDRNQRCTRKRTLEQNSVDLNSTWEVDDEASDGLQPVPAKKLRTVAPSSVGLRARVPAIVYSLEEITALWGGPLDLAWVDQYFNRLRAWANNEVKNQKPLSFFRLRLESAKTAMEMGKISFRLNEELFMRLRVRWQDFFHKGVRRSNALKQHGGDSLGEFYHSLVTWYDEMSSRRVVSPGELERQAVRTATALGVQFRLGKPWLKDFVDKFGFYCNINGKHRLYLKPTEGMLKIHYEVAFQQWYHRFPGTLHRMENFGSSKMHAELYGCWQSYLFTVIEKHVEESETRINYCISENEIAEKICGGNKLTRQIAKWQRKWCEECQTRLTEIANFNDAMKHWYSGELDTNLDNRYFLNSERLEQLSHITECAAEITGVSHSGSAVFNKQWLKRFLELNGCKVFVDGEAIMFTSGDIAELTEKGVANVFKDVWVGFSRMNSRTATPNPTAYPKLHSYLKLLHRTVNISTMDVQGGSLENNSQTTPSHLEALAEHAGSKQLLHHVQHSSETTSTLVTDLEHAVAKWIITKSKDHEVKYQELMSEARSISTSMGMNQSMISHRWMLDFMENQSLHRVLRKGYSVVVGDPEKGSSEAGVLTALIAKSNDPECLAEFEERVSAWYSDTSYKYKDVSPDVVERKAYETALLLNVKGFVPSKHWLADFIKKYGLIFIIKGKRELIPKSDDGIFHFIFEAAFESWYLGVSTRMEVDLKMYLNNVPMTAKAKKHYEAVFDQYLTEFLSNKGVDMRNKSPEHLRVLQEIGSCYWNEAMILLEFDGRTHTSYLSSAGNSTVLRQTLQLDAEGIALQTGLQNFKATKQWMRRFLQRYGLIFGQNLSRFDVISANKDFFNSVFTIWYGIQSIDKTDELMAKLGSLPEDEEMVDGQSECFSLDEERNPILVGFKLPELIHIVRELRGVTYRGCEYIS